MNAQSIIAQHNRKIIEWKADSVATTLSGLEGLIEQNHAFNYQLWHAEDCARRDDMGPEYVYRAKREIDQCNQQRNNRMEAIDTLLWETLKPSTQKIARVHSETPGMMIDRLSILALKAYHMELQTLRNEVSEEHRKQCKQKLEVILAQQAQLGNCFDEFIEGITAKTTTFRVYHQFKMYNDPTLNPELYKQDTEVA